jgi:hypothetical protein
MAVFARLGNNLPVYGKKFYVLGNNAYLLAYSPDGTLWELLREVLYSVSRRAFSLRTLLLVNPFYSGGGHYSPLANETRLNMSHILFLGLRCVILFFRQYFSPKPNNLGFFCSFLRLS